MPRKLYIGPFDLNIPKMGFFIAYKHRGGVIGDLIRAKQLDLGYSEEDAQYTHVEVSYGGQFAVDVAPPKTCVTDIRTHHGGQYLKIVAYNGYPCDPYSPIHHKQYKVAAWAGTACNLKYDFLGVATFVLRFLRQSKNRFFCSENALWALQKEFPEAVGIKPDKFPPAGFLNKEFFNVVWEGVLPSNRR